MTYQEAKEHQNKLQAAVNKTEIALKAIPDVDAGIMGLTPDHVRIAPEYQAAKRAFNVAFTNLRNFNQQFVKTFAKEIRANRRR